MTFEFFHIMMLPFLACLILAGIHAYLGFHVIERQVIFVDLALAQIAVLGASFSLLAGYGLESPQAYWFSLGFTIVGAFVFSLTRFQKEGIPQEAAIGIVYAVSAALLVMILSRSGEGDEHIKQALAGNILLVSRTEVVRIFIIYSIIGVFHYIYRRQFLLISRNPQEALQKGMNVRLWDFLFYVSFGIVVTSSVKIAGVLLIFSFLVVPSVCAIFFSDRLSTRLILGWIIGGLASVAGVALSYYFDFPTGASVVCIFGIMFALATLINRCRPGRL